MYLFNIMAIEGIFSLFKWKESFVWSSHYERLPCANNDYQYRSCEVICDSQVQNTTLITKCKYLFWWATRNNTKNGINAKTHSQTPCLCWHKFESCYLQMMNISKNIKWKKTVSFSPIFPRNSKRIFHLLYQFEIRKFLNSAWI